MKENEMNYFISFKFVCNNNLLTETAHILSIDVHDFYGD